ncbi:UNVERIFIED_CONTAM: hypothetical protein K2H54_060309 [Gekko kuhli]
MSGGGGGSREEERRKLADIINHWNANRLDLFEISPPTEHTFCSFCLLPPSGCDEESPGLEMEGASAVVEELLVVAVEVPQGRSPPPWKIKHCLSHPE